MRPYIPYGHQDVNRDDIAAVVGVLKSDWLTQGPAVKRFEKALCGYTGAKYSVAVSSGTAALHLACLAAGISKPDEVIVPALTFSATGNCVLYAGGKPVFADIEEETGNIDPADILEKAGPRTKAVIPVHYCGLPCDMAEIARTARRKGLVVIEDAAHALGAEYGGKRIGSCGYSDITVFSFHPVKSITTGEGGALLTNRKDLYDRLVALRNHGIVRDPSRFGDKSMRGSPWYYEMRYLGFNYRLTDMQAALGASQLKRLGDFIKRRGRIAAFYDKAFDGNPFFETAGSRGRRRSSHHLYVIRLKGGLAGRRRDFFEMMRAEGIGVQVHYIPVYLHPFYRGLGYRKGLCPVAEDYYGRAVSIPIFPAMRDAQVRFVARKVLDVCRKLSKTNKNKQKRR